MAMYNSMATLPADFFEQGAPLASFVTSPSPSCPSLPLNLDSIDISLEHMLEAAAKDKRAPTPASSTSDDVADRVQRALARIDAGESIPDDEKATLTAEWTYVVRVPVARADVDDESSVSMTWSIDNGVFFDHDPETHRRQQPQNRKQPRGRSVKLRSVGPLKFKLRSTANRKLRSRDRHE